MISEGSTREQMIGLLERVSLTQPADRMALMLRDGSGQLQPFAGIGTDDGIQRTLEVPVWAAGREVGLLSNGIRAEREFSPQERGILELAAAQAGSIIDAHAAALRLDAVQRVTDPALSYLTQDELLPELLHRVSEILRSDTAAILLLEPTGDYVRARAAKGIEEEVEQGVRIPVGKGFAGRIASERRPITIEDVDHADIMNPILRQKGIRSLLGVPLLVEGRVIGVLHVGSLERRLFTVEESDLLQLAGDRAALAIEHAAMYEHRRLAETLQRRLLPDTLDGLPALELANRYLPASGESIGGDWYDAFVLRNGHIWVAVGDVVGHGIAAASVMAQLRTALRAYSAEGHSPPVAVDHVNQLMWLLGPKALTTLALIRIDPEAETLTYVNAGHPPALMIPPDAEPWYLTPPGGVPLGVSPLSIYAAREYPLPAETAVVLFSDGLVESRSHGIDYGLEQLRSLAHGAGDLDDFCSTVVDKLGVADRRNDDIAIAAVRLIGVTDALATKWPAQKEALGDVRHLLRRWLKACGANEDETFDITVACQEACANAVEHAYGPEAHTFQIDAACEDGRIKVVVRDQGRWRQPRGTNRGRGLPLMRALMDVDIEQTDEGTVVTLERDIGDNAR